VLQGRRCKKYSTSFVVIARKLRFRELRTAENHSSVLLKKRVPVNEWPYPEKAPDFRWLRLRTATNHLKSRLLGEEHVPGLPQTALIAAELFDLPNVRLDPRTWASWFQEKPPSIRSKSVMSLDQLSACIDPVDGVGLNFYRDLVVGGLPACLQRKTASKHPYPVLKHRITSYVPSSSLHMHIDAAEIGGVLPVNEHMELSEIKMNAVLRIQEIIFKLWDPRSDLIYSIFSEKKENLGDTSFMAERRRKIDLSTLTDDFDIESSQVHRLLLALAGDDYLLQNRRLFETWALDLATCALLLRSAVWVKRDTVFSSGYRPEIIYLDALESVFFREWDADAFLEFLLRAKSLGRFRWGMYAFKLFHDARLHYHALLSKCGISYLNVVSGCEYCDCVYPFVYTKDK
jgi:hypothetical protein